MHMAKIIDFTKTFKDEFQIDLKFQVNISPLKFRENDEIYLLHELPLSFVSRVEGVELGSPALVKAGTGVRAHQTPDPVFLNSPHELKILK